MIRTLIADDSPYALRSICSCLQDQPNAQIVGTAADGVCALELAERLRPDLALLDLQMPRMSGLEVASHLAAKVPATVVVIVTGLDILGAVSPDLHGVHSVIHKRDMSIELPEFFRKVFPSS